MHPDATRHFLLACCCAVLVFIATGAAAQCTNWRASAQLTAAATCASNGSFKVTLSGPDTANLSNIQFGIPISPNGYSVPLNSSANFTGVPPGTYQVSVVADCNGAPVGRNASIVIPGSYTTPTLTIYKPFDRPSLSCKATGQLYAYTTGGAYPFTFNFTSYPAAYSGPTSFINPGYLTNLPAGIYTIQAIDACLSGTVPRSDTLASLNPAAVPFVLNGYGAAGCDTLIIRPPGWNAGSGPWAGYVRDTLFKVSMKVSGGISSGTTPVLIGGPDVAIKLPAGKTIKDLYGDTVTYTIMPPCGPAIIRTDIIPRPVLFRQTTPNCNINFTLGLSLSMACGPVTYSLRNTATNAGYGPYLSASNSSYAVSALPYGTYSIVFTTADGYTDSVTATTLAPNTNPYSVSVVNGAVGLNNYAAGFTFTTNPSTGGGNKTVELFSGPAGYSFQGQWNSTQPYTVSSNQTPTPTTLKFPAGTYVWKVTDACGVYYLTATVTASDLYQFTVGTPAQQASCQGLWITPVGTATNNGAARTVGFAILLNGSPLQTSTPSGVKWLVYPLGTPILLTAPGIYTIVPSSATTAINLSGYYNPGSFTLGYPNSYTSYYTFTYTQQPLAVDINKTQGFICKGAAPGQGQIYAAGKGGLPFTSAPAPHYRYYLAAPGNAVSGPYIDSNSTGIFTGFGGNANALYDLKVVDTCAAFAVQQIKILDLGTARLISSSSYVSCTGGQVQLSAIFLPGATYLWAGPNGFTSSIRQPILTNTTVANAGVYHVTIVSGQCNTPVSDSTTLVISGGPPKPIISYTCLPKPVQLSVSNASTGLVYNWEIGRFFVSTPTLLYSRIQQPSDTPWSKAVLYIASYKAIALDTVTSCYTLSDSLLFLGDPNNPLVASIYSPHLQLCAGDTTVLVARGQGNALSVAYQWYRSGAAIPGATGVSYAAYSSGTYRVFIDAGLCNRDTSAPVSVSVIPYPTAAITPSALRICQGDTAQLQATTGAGYTYTWYRAGSTIPGAFSSLYPATTSGSYYVIISNGGCIATAAPITITVVPLPVVTISPSTIQSLCPGDSIRFSTAPDTGFIYRWERNGQLITGAVSDSYYARQGGAYRVLVATALCPYTPSPAVTVRILPTNLYLGPDTTDCNLPSSLQLSLQVDSLFSSIRWSTGATTPAITTNGPGIYWVRAANSCGVYSDTLHINSIADYLPALPDDTLVCNATQTAMLHVPPMLGSIHWSTGAIAQSILVKAPGRYWVSGHTPCGPISDTVNVAFCAPHIQQLTLSDDSLCEGECMVAGAAVNDYPTVYEWTFEGGTPASSSRLNPGTICYPAAGVFPVRLIAANIGGADTAYGTVVVSAKPKPRFKDTLMTLAYKSVISTPACAAAQHADWYIGDSLICRDCPELSIDARYYLTRYRCVVRNGDCPDSCTYTLRVIDIPNDLWLPDAFTPNGDSRNDIFHIITDNPNILVINLDVFNRWGQHVFRSNVNNGGWDGTLAGRPAEVGTYFWQVRYKVRGREDLYYKKGEVLLMR